MGRLSRLDTFRTNVYGVWDDEGIPIRDAAGKDSQKVAPKGPERIGRGKISRTSIVGYHYWFNIVFLFCCSNIARDSFGLH
jgi:hypothetical protein